VDFKELFRMLRRRWKTIAAMFLLAVVFSGVISAATPKRYESKAAVFVTADARNLTESSQAAFLVSGRVTSYAALVSQRGLMQRVIDRLNLTLSPDQLANRVSAEVPEGTQFVDMSAKEDDPDKAQTLATALSEEFVTYIEELETPNGQEASQIKATITDPATFNGDPVAPQTMLNLIIAALLGLVLGAGLALVRDLLDNTVKSVEDVEEVTKAPVMASVGIDKTMSRQPMLTDVKGFSPRGEAFRMLRTNLQYLDLDNPPKSLVITSAIAGEGKTSTSTNLAVALAQAGRRVLLIDGDLRRPRVAALLGLESSVGLTTVLVGRTKLEESIQRHQASGVYFLAGGPTPPNPTEVLQSQATHDLLAKLRAAYDAVIIDAPPLLPVADAAILGTSADGAILVTRHGKTHREELEAATQRLEKVGARLFGTVVNMIPKRSGGSYSYYYYYEYDTSTPRKTGGARVAK
jgi:capsular exopolysaccharide synthesis family protein